MNVWVDEIIEAPSGYHWCKSMDELKTLIVGADKFNNTLMDYFEDSIVGEWFIKIDAININELLRDQLENWLNSVNMHFVINMHK